MPLQRAHPADDLRSDLGIAPYAAGVRICGLSGTPAPTFLLYGRPLRPPGGVIPVSHKTL